MIPVAEARARILADVATAAPEETLPVARGLGRVLAKDVRAPFDVPPADNSAVDGYAVRAADLDPGGRARVRVVADLPAGAVYEGGIGPREALRIMTGAPMPRGADTVVPAGARRERGRLGRASRGRPRRERAVTRRGRPGRRGRAPGGRGAAPAGAGPRRVARLRRGARAPPAARRPALHRRRGGRAGPVRAAPGRSTTPTASRSAARSRQPAPSCSTSASCPTSESASARASSQAAGTADVVLTSGGVSVGDYDLVKSVLGEIGGIDFWQVAMQPGRPLAVGRIGATHFFGLPGQPRRLDAQLPPLRPPGPLEAGRADAARPRAASRRPPSSRCARGRAAASSSAASSGSPTTAARSAPPAPRARASSPRWPPPTASSSSRRTGATSTAGETRPRRAVLSSAMARGITTDLIDGVKRDGRRPVHGLGPRLPRPRLRRRPAGGHRGQVRERRRTASPSSPATTTRCAFGVRVLAGDRMVGAGLLRAAPWAPPICRDLREHPARGARAARYRRAAGQRRGQGGGAREVRTARRVARRHAPAPGPRGAGHRPGRLPRRPAHGAARRAWSATATDVSRRSRAPSIRA